MSSITENFDSYNNGRLYGQGNWVDGGGAHPELIVVYSGKAKWFDSTHTDGSANGAAKLPFTGLKSGSISFKYYCSSTSGRTGIQIKDGSTIVCFIDTGETGAGKVRLGGATNVDFGTYSANTWYLIELEFDVSTQKVRARFNSGTWSSWINAANSFTKVDGFFLYADDSRSITTYWDDISITGVEANVFIPQIIFV